MSRYGKEDDRMTISTILAVVGVIVTVFFGGWGVYVVIKRRYPGRIVLIKEASLGLFDSVVKNLPELSIRYRDVPVSEGLVLFKGALINNGAKDITLEMVEEELAVNLPEGFKWLTAKVVSVSPKVEAQLRVSAQRITFETGMFRSGEHIRFEALAEVPVSKGTTPKGAAPMGKQLEEALRVTHRIADTQKVEMVEVSATPQSGKRLRALKILTGGCLAVMVAYGVSFYVKGWPAAVNFLMPVEDEKTVEVSIVPKSDGTLAVRGVREGYRESIEAPDFFQKDGLIARVVQKPGAKYQFVLLIFAYLAFPSVLWIMYYLEERKMRRFRKLLSAGEERNGRPGAVPEK